MPSGYSPDMCGPPLCPTSKPGFSTFRSAYVGLQTAFRFREGGTGRVAGASQRERSRLPISNRRHALYIRREDDLLGTDAKRANKLDQEAIPVHLKHDEVGAGVFVRQGVLEPHHVARGQFTHRSTSTLFRLRPA